MTALPNTTIPRHPRGLLLAMIGAWLLVATVVGWGWSTSPPVSLTARWFDKRQSMEAIAVITAFVVTLVWIDRVAFGPLGERRETGTSVVLFVTAAWALPLLGSLAGLVAGPVGVVIAIGSLILLCTALVTTGEWGSPRAITWMVAGNWLGAGGACLFVLIKFVIAPPASANICTLGGMDCIGTGGPNESIAWLCLYFVFITIALAVIQLVVLVAGWALRRFGLRGRVGR